MRTLVAMLAMSLALVGCATPPLYSSDGARIVNFDRPNFEYRVPGKPETQCHFEKAIGQIVCADGTASAMRAAGLPFHGVIFVEFDGRRFRPED